MQFRVQQLSFVPWPAGLCHNREALKVETKTELSACVVEACSWSRPIAVSPGERHCYLFNGI